MRIIAIDPGETWSGVVWWYDGMVRSKGMFLNSDLVLRLMSPTTAGALGIEWLSSYGMAVGRSVFNTCRWVGHFESAWESHNGNPKANLITRKEVKLHLCGNSSTNDKFVREALIDRIGPVGTKKNPGPLYGISGHLFSALAVAVTLWDRLNEVSK